MSRLEDVVLEKRMEKGGAIAFFQGDYTDDSHGNPKEEWIWLPKSQIEVVDNSDGMTVTVTMPLWLAKEKGLI